MNIYQKPQDQQSTLPNKTCHSVPKSPFSNTCPRHFPWSLGSRCGEGELVATMAATRSSSSHDHWMMYPYKFHPTCTTHILYMYILRSIYTGMYYVCCRGGSVDLTFFWLLPYASCRCLSKTAIAGPFTSTVICSHDVGIRC